MTSTREWAPSNYSQTKNSQRKVRQLFKPASNPLSSRRTIWTNCSFRIFWASSCTSSGNTLSSLSSSSSTSSPCPASASDSSGASRINLMLVFREIDNLWSGWWAMAAAASVQIRKKMQIRNIISPIMIKIMRRNWRRVNPVTSMAVQIALVDG